MDHRIHVAEDHTRQLVDFIHEYSSLARAHPNQAATSGVFPHLVQQCFSQPDAKDENSSEELWMTLVRDYQRDNVISNNEDFKIPPDVSRFIRQCAALAIPRAPFYVPPPPPATVDNRERAKGVTMVRVSPKKMHEVSTMSAYIAATFPLHDPTIPVSGSQEHDGRSAETLTEGKILDDSQEESPCSHKRHRRPYIVDVGAGQGYLSRALAAYGFHVLALDADERQTTGSLSRTDWLETATTAGVKEGKGSKGRGPSGADDATKVQNLETNANPNTNITENEDNEDQGSKGSVSNRTVFIDDADALTSTIDEWIQERHHSPALNYHQTPSCGFSGRVPVVVVGLHACGDLTPAILNFIHRQHASSSSTSLFKLVGCVVVGCCYNMMTPSSFPLSQRLSRDLSTFSVGKSGEETGSDFKLDTQHLHLAAQAPKTWSLDAPPSSERANLPFEIASSTALSMRKIAYRALLARRLPSAYRAETQSKPGHDDAATQVANTTRGGEWPPNLDDVDWRTRRIGRLATSVYKDFATFLKAARVKLDLPPNVQSRSASVHQENASAFTTDIRPASQSQEPNLLSLTNKPYPSHGEGDMESDLCAYEAELAQKIQVFQVLRCFLGPLVESLLVLDRYWFLVQAIRSSSSERQYDESPEEGESVQLINLFDQSTGSLRNTALVWKA